VGAEKEDAQAKTVGSASAKTGDEKEQKTITLALAPADAEKVVYAQENGKIWFGLHPPTGAEVATTQGKTLKTIFK